MSSAQGVWSGSVPAESTAMNGIRNGTTELPPPVSRERHGSSGASSVASVPTYPQHHHQHNNVNGFPSFRRGGGMRDYGGRRNFGRRGGMRNFDDPRGYSDYYKGPHMSMHGNNFHYSRQWNDYNAPRERRTSMQYRDNQTLSRRSSPVRARYEDNMEEGSTLPRYRAAGTAPSSSISPFAAGQNLTKSDALNVTREMSSTTPQSSPNGGVQSQTDKDVDFKFLLQSALWQTSSPYATVSTPTQEAAPSYKSAGNSPDGNSEAAAAASNFSAAFSNAVSQQSMYAWILQNYALSCRAQNAGTQTPSSSSSSSNDATNNIDWTRVSRTDFATNEDVMRAVQQLAKNANTSAAAAAAAAAATAGAMPMTMPSPQLAAITAAAIAGGYQPQLAYMSQDERNNLELFSRLNGLPSLPYYPHPSLSHNRPGSNGQPHLTSQPPPPVLPPATASTSRHPSSSSMYGGSNNSINTLGVNTSIPPPPTPSSLSSANRVQHPPPIPSKDAPVNVSRSLSGNVNGVPKANEVHHVAPQKECYSAVLQRGNSDAERDRPKVAVKKEEVPVRTNQPAEANRPNLDSLKSSLPTVSTATNGDASNTVKQTLELINKDVIKDSTMLSGPPPPTSASILASGQFQVSKMDVLSENIWHYHNKVAQTDAMLHRKLHLRDMLYYAIAPVFPMCGLYVVGSSLNGFGNNSSDMDLCLMITNKELDQRTDAVVVLNMVLSTLQHEKIVVSQQLILAKVPIVRIRFTEPFLDIQVDLNANNSVAIKNTHLLCYYSSFDWRVRPIVSVVKEWAKRKGINDANRSTFTSYSLVLMVIHYLQYGADPPVLPNLQKMYPNRFSNKCDVRTLNVTLPLSPPPESTEWKFNDSATLGELLIGFLDYYASKFNYDRDAISIRQGRRIERAAVARQRTGMSSSSMSSSSLSHGGSNIPATAWRAQWRCVCIEEPFTNSNTAHSIYDEMVFGAIKDAFREAHSELERNRDLSRLLDCKPINVAAPVGGAIVYTTNYEERSVITATSAPAPPPSIASSIRNMLPMGMFQQHKHKQQVQRNLPHPSQQQHLPQAVAQAFHASNVAPPPPPPPTTANTVTTSAVTTASLTSSAATTPSVSPTRLLDDVVPSAATSVAVQMTPEKPQPAKPQQNGKTSQKKAAPQKSNTAVNKSNSSANHHGGQQQHNPNQNSSRKSAAGGKDGSNKERK